MRINRDVRMRGLLSFGRPYQRTRPRIPSSHLKNADKTEKVADSPCGPCQLDLLRKLVESIAVTFDEKINAWDNPKTAKDMLDRSLFAERVALGLRNWKQPGALEFLAMNAITMPWRLSSAKPWKELPRHDSSSNAGPQKPKSHRHGPSAGH